MDLSLKAEALKEQSGKSIFTRLEAANYLGVKPEDIDDLVNCGELRAVGNKKDKIRLVDLINFEMSGFITSNDVRVGNSLRNIQFFELTQNYLEYSNGVTQSRTFSNNVLLAKHIDNDLGLLWASEINTEVLQKFINNFTNRLYVRGAKTSYYSQSTINKVYDLLRGVVVYGTEKGVFPIDYTQKLKKPVAKKYIEHKVQALTDAEVCFIIGITETNEFLHVYIHILLYTGMRPSEALALKRADIDFNKKTISVTRALSYTRSADILGRKVGRQIAIIKNLKNERNGKKLYRKRTLKVSDKVIDVIQNWITIIEKDEILCYKKKKHKMEEFLFCGSDGQLAVPDYYFQIYERHLQKYGLKYSQYNPYRFRHNFCTRALRQGNDPKIVQALMGDDTLEMVLRVYDSLNDSEILKASNEFAQNMDYTLSLVDSNNDNK